MMILDDNDSRDKKGKTIKSKVKAIEESLT